MTQFDPEIRFKYEMFSAIKDLTRIVKDHLTDGSGRTKVSFHLVDSSLQAAQETLYKIQSDSVEKEKI
jgi:hypothetical protein